VDWNFYRGASVNIELDSRAARPLILGCGVPMGWLIYPLLRGGGEASTFSISAKRLMASRMT
jgi:hypothetical protein